MITITLRDKEFIAAIRRYVDRVGQGQTVAMERLSKRLRVRIMGYTPVASKRLQRSWIHGTVKLGGGKYNVSAKVATDVPYAPVVEYGLYRGAGPRTRSLTARDLGAGFVAAAGVYSTQAPWGMVRRGMADEFEGLVQGMRANVRDNWGKP